MGDRKASRSQMCRAFTEVGLLQTVEEEWTGAAASERETEVIKAKQEIEGKRQC